MRSNVSILELIGGFFVVAFLTLITITYLQSVQHQQRSSGNEPSAISSLRSISSAQAIYLEKNNCYANLQQLGSANLIDSILANGTKSGYKIALNPKNDDKDHPTYTATASPVLSGYGFRYFFLDQTGVIRHSTGPATTASPPLGSVK